ncbi:MAG: hypothetical protein QM758_24495 [Armatimonas sp.]
MNKSVFFVGAALVGLLMGCSKPSVEGKWTGSLQMGSVASNTELNLGPSGQASGTATSIAGKTSFTGTYKLDGDKIQLQFPLTGPAAEMAKKVGMSTDVKINETYKLDGDTLTIGQSTLTRAK